MAAVRSAVRAALRDAGPTTVLVACSGGADSLALAAATAFEAPRAGVPAGLITIDHGLSDGSAAQAQRVAAIGTALGLAPVIAARVTVGSAGGPEAAARAARYEALRTAAAEHSAHVLLAHTQNDQAETVLLGLGRGSGPRSIAGMARRDGIWLRPLLGLRRATTEAACRAADLTPWRDPQNVDPAFARVRLRRTVLPALEDALQGGVTAALARTAELLRDDLDALDGWAATVRTGLADEPAVDALRDLPRAVRTRVLRSWAHDAGARPLSAERTAALDALLVDWHGQGPVALPGGVTVTRTGTGTTARLVARRMTD